MGPHNLGNIFCLDADVEYALGFDNDDGAVLTETMAASEFNAHVN
jgi:hypothetical protein